MFENIQWNRQIEHQKGARAYADALNKIKIKRVKVNITNDKNSTQFHFEVLKKDRLGYWKRELSELICLVSRHVPSKLKSIVVVEGNFTGGAGYVDYAVRAMEPEDYNKKIYLNNSVVGARVEIANKNKHLHVPSKTVYLKTY